MLNLCYQDHKILLLLKYFYQCTDEDHDQFWCPTDFSYFTTDVTTNTTNKTMWGNCGSGCKLEGMFLPGNNITGEMGLI